MERLAGHVMLLWGLKRALVAFAAGALAVLALPPFDFFAVLFVSFSVLVWLIDGACGAPGAGFFGRLKPAFWIGWWFGFGYFVAGLWWIGAALLVEADSFAWALPLAVVGLPAVLAVYYGLAAAFAGALWSDGAARIAALALAFGLAEWLRGFVATGFPWNAIGYGAMPVPVMMQSVHIVGLLGMNALTVLVFSAPALIGTRRGAVPGLAVALVLLCAHLGYGWFVLSRLPAYDGKAPDAPVFRIVQPSIDQAVRLDSSRNAATFETYLDLSRTPLVEGTRTPDYIVWPETAVPFILTETPDALRRIADMLEPDQTLIAGAIRVEEGDPGDPPRFYNSIDVVDTSGTIVAAADKVHLVPFGEYLPFKRLWTALGVSEIAMPGGFSAAPVRRTLPLPGNLVALPLICYEVIFPEGIAASGPRPDFILNVTNDAWYGDTIGPYQHVRQARIRAVQTGLPLVRAGNNGISIVADGYGRISAGLGLDRTAVVDSALGAKNRVVVTIVQQKVAFWMIILVLAVTIGTSWLVSRRGHH